jgi:hypothetical protein
MVKSLELKASVKSFLSSSAKEKLVNGSVDEETNKELSAVKEFFKVSEVDSVVSLRLSLENMLWRLFENVKVPESPLRLKAHERFLGRVAENLKATLDTEELPKLEKNDLKQVLHMVEDPEIFSKLELPFEYTAEDGTVRVLPLPATNILQNEEFVSTVDELFVPCVEQK